MSSDKNKVIRERLEAKYGKVCMFQKAKIAERIEAHGGIDTYTAYIRKHKYTPKKVIRLEHQRTLHHLVHRSEGGSTTEQNGAVVNALAHGYLHSLPRDQEEIINNMLREYKRTHQKCKIEFTDNLDTGVEITYTLLDFPPEKAIRKEKFNRAKEKRKTQELIEEDLDYEM